MNFNDLTVKLTSNANYQSLQTKKQEQLKALIKEYESYAQNITQSFYDNFAKMQKEEQDRINNEKTWGTILNFATLGTYPVVKGLVDGLTDFATGVVNIGTELVNNIGQVIVTDGRFGGSIDGYFKELGSDLLYTVSDPLISVVEGLTKGAGSVANIFGWDDKEFNMFLNATTKIGVDTRDWILTFGEKEKDYFGSDGFSESLNNTPNKDKVSRIEEHTWDWARDSSKAVAQGGTWFKDNVSPIIAKIVNPLGIAIDDLGQNSAGEFFSGTMESIGRMIPSVVASYYGNSTALASTASQIYFFSSSFGNGFSEAIARGATVEEAYTYGYGVAAVETLTEQIGGVKIGKLLPGGANKVATSMFGKVLQHPVIRVIKSGVSEGMEEVMSEAMSAGLESIISDEPVNNSDFMSRAMSAFLGGAISGGIFSGVGYYAHQKSTIGKVNSLNNEIKKIYEGQNQDYGKAQQVFNQKVDGLLNSYNKDSVLDNNIFEMVYEDGNSVIDKESGKRNQETRLKAKKDYLEKSGFASVLIEYNEKNQNFQLTKKGIEMTTDLESYMGDSNKNAYSSTLYGLEDTLATKATNQELTSEQQDVMKLSKKLGSDVVFYTDSDTSINGFFKDGVVYLNTESKKGSLTNFTHELTHSLEGTKQYDTLKNFIMEISETNETLKAKMEELGLTKENIIKDYWNQISKLNNIESRAYLVASEYVAFAMSEVILKDKASIENLTKNKTLGRKILNWIKEKIADIKTPKTDIEKAFLKDLKQAKDLYEEALGLGYRKGLNISEVDKRFSKTTDSEGRKLTVEQEKYFKDSKVRDAKGGLQVVYHGTNSKFNEFAFSKIDKSNPKLKGFWFINNKQNAYQYGDNIKEGYVNITKPLSLEDKHINKEQYTKFLEYVFNNDGENKTLIQQKDFKENISELYDSIENDYELINYIQSMYNEDSKISRFNEILKEKTGYDGAIFEDGGNTIAISLFPNQFKAVDNLTPTSDSDVRYSRNVENGIDNNVEMEILDKVIKDTHQNYNKKTYLDTTTKRQKSFNEINLKEIAKTTNGKKRVKVIETLMKDYEQIIKKNYNRSELYNHIFNNVIQEIILELSNNFGDTTFTNKARVVDSIELIVSQTLAYMDNTFNNNDVNKLNPRNPQGFQYTRLINWGFRELLDASTPNERNAVLQSRKLSPLWDMIENIVKLDITNNQSILEFNAGIKNFFEKTRVAQVNTMALDSNGEFAHTIPVVLKQNDTHIENLTKLVGTMELQSKDGKKTTYKRTNGLLGDVRLFDKLSGTRLDMFAFGNIFGLFMEESTGSVMTNRIYEAQKQQLEASNKFYEYFEKDGFLKKNRKNIDLLEQEVSSLTNLLDGNGNPIIIPNSEVVYLRDIMLREIVRDRIIENGYRGGEQSNYFKDGGVVFINGNSNNRKTNEANRVQAKIINVLDLFNELDSIVKENKFMTEYNQKLLGFFELMYEFENARNKDISGLELTNDKDTIANLTEEQRATLTSGLNEVNIDSIYVPVRSVGSNKSSGAGAFNINNVIDLGIDDGMVMGITESNNPPLIDSINNIIPQYTRSVANFYGLFRVVNDLNILFNKEITLSDGSQITLADKVAKVSPYIVPYYEKLLRDISGYGVNSDITSEGFNRFMGKIRRNFFKASLGLNAKVILTQFASLFTISTMYGDFKGTKKSLMLSTMKNIFAKGSKTKAKYLIENSEIYKDRARNSTYEISEATSSAFNKSKFNEVTEFFMKGITITDNMINRAFFISLVEHGYTEAQALKMTEEAISRYQSSGLSINKNELLRTQNELVRVFTKFLGEPMKVVSNMEESIKHLQIINRLEKNQEAINKSFDNDLVESQKLVETLKQEKVAIENLIDNEKNKANKKVLEKTLKDIDNNIRIQEENVLEQEKNNAQVKKQVQGVIDGKDNTRKELGKRVTALTLSITWQVLLGVAFSALRTGGRDKDEDEEVWSYLGKKFGWQLASEAMGFLPFARDIYSLIVDKYDANVVSDFQAFNDLGSAISGIITDMTNGGDFNYGKHIRKVSIHLGQMLGIPTRQIERLFTTPSNYFMKGANYTYRDITGQYTTNKELTNAIKNGDDKLVETILNRRLDSKRISLTNSVSKEINRLAKNGVVVSPSGIPDSFSIDGVEYKNDKDKFAKTYNNATFVVEKIITLSGYKRLDDEYKAKLIKAIFTYYHSLAKQNVSGVQIFTKERTYNLNQAYRYFRDRISYYMNLQQKEKKKKRA